MSKRPDFRVSRRNFNRGLLGALAAPGVGSAMSETPNQTSAKDTGDAGELFAELDEKIQRGMAEFPIPGAAVAVIYKGREFVKGYGYTDVGHPDPKHAVDANTSFRVASISKPFTGTAAMRLVEAGKLDLDAPVTGYIKGVQLPVGAERVTMRQLLKRPIPEDQRSAQVRAGVRIGLASRASAICLPCLYHSAHPSWHSMQAYTPERTSTSRTKRGKPSSKWLQQMGDWS